MTKITIFKNENLVCGYQIKGHSGYAEAGQDIVCSAVSTASQMTLVALKEVLNLAVESDIQDGYMQVLVAKEDWKNDSVQTVLVAMEKTLQDIAKHYARYVKLEVKKDVY